MNIQLYDSTEFDENVAANVLTGKGSGSPLVLCVDSLYGKVVHSEQPMSMYMEIDVSQFASGEYFIQFETESGVSAQKFIKQ